MNPVGQMNETSEFKTGSVAVVAGPTAAWPVAWASVVFGAAWVLLFNQLRVDWTINPQYRYGWVAPLLALGLFHLRWQNRPIAAAAHGSSMVAVAAAGLLALLLPFRLIEEANPERRLIMWMLTRHKWWH